jgi:hypothetical protein
VINGITIIGMVGSIMDRLIGKYCKIVVREPGEERAHIIFGMLMNIDYNERLVVIESNPRSVYLSLDTIVAIKPRRQK